MADISNIFRLVDNHNYLPFLLVKSAIHLAELGEAIEEYFQNEVNSIPNQSASAARYIHELREQADKLCKEYGADLIMPHFRTELGNEKFSLYLGKN